jgi:hypothetical protein
VRDEGRNMMSGEGCRWGQDAEMDKLRDGRGEGQDKHYGCTVVQQRQRVLHSVQEQSERSLDSPFGISSSHEPS